MSALLAAGGAVLAASAVIRKWTLALVLVGALWIAIGWIIDRIRQVRETRAEIERFLAYRDGAQDRAGVAPRLVGSPRRITRPSSSAPTPRATLRGRNLFLDGDLGEGQQNG